MQSDFTYSITIKEHYLSIDLIGSIEPDKIVETAKSAAAAILSNNALNFPQIWDVTKSDLSRVDQSTIQLVIEKLSTLRSQINPPKIALVSQKEINLGILSLFKECCTSNTYEISVFNHSVIAEKWIRGES